MREIRFRAWDKKNKKMFYFCKGYFIDSLEGALIFDREESGKVLPSFMEDEKCNLMQYTGLKDKNGKEIYEGDIVGVPYVNPLGGTDDKWSYKAKVIFDFGCYWIDYEDKGERPVPQEILDWVERKKGEYISNFGEPLIFENKVRLEVIGNIYENPDLKEEGKKS